MKLLKNPRLLLILSMIIFGTIGLFVKYIPLSSGEVALYRAILAIILLGLFLLITKQNSLLSSQIKGKYFINNIKRQWRCNAHGSYRWCRLTKRKTC